MANVVCVVLAAGRSSRMGAQKVLLQFEGRTLLERALDATAAFERILVISSALADLLPPGAAGVRTIVNAETERGMTHSLRLADAAVADRNAALAVVLADTPLVDAEVVARIVAARGEADVAYPVRDGVPGHPVVFGPSPRARIGGLSDGDTLRQLRADARWTRVEVPVDDDRPFLDLDTPADFERARAWARSRALPDDDVKVSSLVEPSAPTAKP